MTTEEIFRLILDYGQSAKDTGLITEKLGELKVKAEETGNHALAGLTAKVSDLAEKFLDLKLSGEDGAKSVFQVGHAALDVFGQLKEGSIVPAVKGIGEIVKLVPGMVLFSGVIDGVGKAAEIAAPYLDKYWKEFDDRQKIVQEVTKDTKEYVAALRSEIDALKDSEAVKAARESDETDKAAPGRQQRESAQEFKALGKGRQEEALDEIFQALFEPIREAAAKAIEDAKSEYEESLKRIQESNAHPAIKQEMRDIAAAEFAKQAKAPTEAKQKEAEALFAKAQAGDADALAQIQEILPEGSTTREVARMASPENMAEAARAKAAAEETRQRNLEERKRAAEDEAESNATLNAADQRRRDWRSKQAETQQQEREQALDAAHEFAQGRADAAQRMADFVERNSGKFEAARKQAEAAQEMRGVVRAQTGIELTPAQAAAAVRHYQALLAQQQQATLQEIMSMIGLTREQMQMWSAIAGQANQMNRSQGSFNGSW
jgi:hypothetical protein